MEHSLVGSTRSKIKNKSRYEDTCGAGHRLVHSGVKQQTCQIQKQFQWFETLEKKKNTSVLGALQLEMSNCSFNSRFYDNDQDVSQN